MQPQVSLWANETPYDNGVVLRRIASETSTLHVLDETSPLFCPAAAIAATAAACFFCSNLPNNAQRRSIWTCSESKGDSQSIHPCPSDCRVPSCSQHCKFSWTCLILTCLALQNSSLLLPVTVSKKAEKHHVYFGSACSELQA